MLLFVERPRPDRIRNRPNAWRLAVAAVCFGAFMGQLDASIVTLTYPAMERHLHASLAGVEWVSLAYLLTLVGLLIPLGRISDTRGRKLIYLQGFVVFTAASAACGLAPSLAWLVAARVVQGIGAAMLQANSVALVTTSAPDGRRRSALGIQAAAQAMGLALGPTLGGILVSTAGWRWVYFINVPVGVMAVVAGRYLLPRTHDRAPRVNFDPAGLGLLLAALASALLLLSAASGLSWPAWLLALLGVAAVTAGWALVERERRTPDPLIDVRLLADGGLARALAGGLGGYLVLFGLLVAVPVILTRHGMAAWQAGLVLTALPAGFALGALTSDVWLPAGWSDRRRGVAGALGVVVAVGIAVGLPVGAGWLAGTLAVAGLGLGVFTPANNAAVMRGLPRAAAGTGGGLVNTTRGLGTALGIALVTLCLHGGSVGGRLAFGALATAAAGVALAAASAPRADFGRDS